VFVGLATVQSTNLPHLGPLGSRVTDTSRCGFNNMEHLDAIKVAIKARID
jgi:hypothetical protein